MHSAIIRCSIQNKLVRNGAIDGIETFESTKKSCTNCLTRVINKNTHYFHRGEIMNYENILSGLEEVYKAHVIEEIELAKTIRNIKK